MNDLQKRLVAYSVMVYGAIKPLMKEKFLEPVIKQLIRSSTSVGANYSEAQTSSSYKDFFNKIKIAQKELKESEYWLVYLSRVAADSIDLTKEQNESIELLKIFSVISKKADLKLKLDAKTKTFKKNT